MFTPIISGLSFYDIAVYFVLFAILGYILEVIYAAVVLGKFVNVDFSADVVSDLRLRCSHGRDDTEAISAVFW